jgi:hypothetical protein
MANLHNVRRIRATARILNCDPGTVRRMDRLGLFTPRRDRRGYRVYDDRDIEALRAILASRKPGPRPKKNKPPPKPLVPVLLGDQTIVLTASEIQRGLKRGRGLTAPLLRVSCRGRDV